MYKTSGITDLQNQQVRVILQKLLSKVLVNNAYDKAL